MVTVHVDGIANSEASAKMPAVNLILKPVLKKLTMFLADGKYPKTSGMAVNISEMYLYLRNYVLMIISFTQHIAEGPCSRDIFHKRMILI